MTKGFLGLETLPEDTDKTGLIRLVSWDELPLSKDKQYPVNIHYIARFNDILAAQMHFHNGLRTKLEDVNEHSYRADLNDAIAVIEAEGELWHERIWIDPAINDKDLARIKEQTAKIRSKKRKINLAVQLLGYAAIALLAFYGLASFI